MNEGFTSHRPPDEEPDPLLEALRQRLGVGYGQEPSPELWSGIYQRLPAPASRPWWLRARRRLPLLAGLLLLISLVLVRQTVHPPLTYRPAQRPTAQPARPGAATGAVPSTQWPVGVIAPSARPAGRLAATAPAATSGTAATPVATPAGNAAVSTSAATTARTIQPTRLRDSNKHLVAPAKTPMLARSRVAGRRAARASGLMQERGAAGTGELAGGSLVTRRRPPQVARQLSARAHSGTALFQRAGLISTHGYPPAAARRAERREKTARRSARLAAQPAPTLASPGSHQQPTAVATSRLAASTRRRDSATPSEETGQLSAFWGQLPVHEEANRVGSTATLALRRVEPLQPASRLPASLTARPDSFAPRLAPVRRWAVLVLAGPTLSYRTLPSSTLAYAASPLTAASNTNTSTRANTSFADLEEPAAGLGAQVQARRVLAGRWALALGLGYQEYATRISTKSNTQPAYYYSPTNSAAIDTSKSATGNLRDTYRLLTLPVQLSYALGPPRGRVALSLLGGFEPGWYLGGQSTEASSCHCQQQSFTSASGSPYNAFTVGLSLGLDVRYRLGGPVSRWQLVLQPTGRYVATAFVRNTSLYVRRQPYSLGLLTGVAWAF